MERYLLMIPGPVEISPDILEAFNGQTIAHYGPDWTEIYLTTEGLFSRLVGSDGRTFLMPGSGSLGLETVATTYCRNKRVLVPINGSFGDRLHAVVRPQAAHTQTVRLPLDRAMDPQRIRDELRKESFDAVFMVHGETSTGMLNPIAEIAEVVHEHGARFFIDAVASAGIEEIDMGALGVDAVVTSSQKGMECPPGLGIVCVRKAMMDELDHRDAVAWFTDLKVWCEYYDKWHDWHPFPMTLPTNTILALRKSMDKMFDEGPENRRQSYRDVSQRLRKAMEVLGLQLFAGDGEQAHGLTSVRTGGRFHPSEIVTYMRNEQKIRISGSFGDIKDEVFRFGHMSSAQCRPDNLRRVVEGIGRFLESRDMANAAVRDEAAGIAAGTD